MSLYICPRCGNPGTKAEARNHCTNCSRRDAMGLCDKSEAAPAAPKRIEKRGVDETAMKGFNPVSQQFLQRKWS